LTQVAAARKVDFKSIVLMSKQTPDAVTKAVTSGQVDAATLLVLIARDILTARQAMLVGWVSESDESQLGAVFASVKMIS
jgi:hypothetical protein